LKASFSKLIKGYIEKSEKKLAVAEKLLKTDDYEDAVSRAYYAVFHTTQALLLTEGEKAERISVDTLPIVKMTEEAGIMRYSHI